MATQTRYRHMQPGSAWVHHPESGSDADVDQAIAAKLHINMRMLPLLAGGQLAIVEPRDARFIGDWDDEAEDLARFIESAPSVPISPLFLDLEAVMGQPLAWEADSWPLPLHLRGALCWNLDDGLSVIPFGSVGGRHPWGGTDYQAWGRCLYLHDDQVPWPMPGPGDVLIKPDGTILAWVDLNDDSVCSQQSRVTTQLANRVVRLLWFLQGIEASFGAPNVPRPERRRAQRDGKKFGVVPSGLPSWAADETADADAADEALVEAFKEECPFPGTHSRLNAAHALWHEAMDVYDDPVSFVNKTNSLIQALRNVTFVLQKEIGDDLDLTTWYARWRRAMEDDRVMKWLIRVRNEIVKEGDLRTHSKARVWIAGPGTSRIEEFPVEPNAPAHEIARKLMVAGGIPERLRRDGTLVVERRWTVDGRPDDELLDLLAHCYGVLADLVIDAHGKSNCSLGKCAETADDPCPDHSVTRRLGARMACMYAAREARTSRRSLASGALVPQVGILSETVSPLDPAEVSRRYTDEPWERLPLGADVFEQAEVLHTHARRMFAADGHHVTIAWLFRDRRCFDQFELVFEDQRAKHLVIERVAAEIERRGADALVVTAEMWEASVVPDRDARATLLPGEREDRRESLVTYAVEKSGSRRSWRSAILRPGEQKPQLADAEISDDGGNLALAALISAWRRQQ